jgi:tRNA-binding protein
MTQLKAQAPYGDFARLDLQIGKVAEVQPFPRARNPSYKVGVDVGTDRIMWSSAQIKNYPAEVLVGSLVVCVCNLGPKNYAQSLGSVKHSRARKDFRFHTWFALPRRVVSRGTCTDG